MQLFTVDPTLTALGLPVYPALSATTDPAKVEEIRRTVYVGNIPKNCTGEEVMQFFNDNIGEVNRFLFSLTNKKNWMLVNTSSHNCVFHEYFY